MPLSSFAAEPLPGAPRRRQATAPPRGGRGFYRLKPRWQKLNRARYYQASVGRFSQEDPAGFEAGIHFYSYVRRNPISWKDPIGLDAIYVSYKGYPVPTPLGFDAPLGHAAVIAIDPKTGTTKYFEYGRYGGDFGSVRGPADRPIPDVIMGKDGRPTEESLKDLYDFISENYGKGHSVEAEYFSDADYRRVVEFAYRRMRDPNRKPYSWKPWNANHCKTFAREAIQAGRR